MKSALLFAVPEVPDAILSATRNLLAWEDIDDDEETKKRLDEGQRKQLVLGIGRAQADLKESIWRAYRHVYLLDKTNSLKDVNLGQVTSSSAGSIIELIVRELTKQDQITEGVGPNQLVKFWPPAMEKWSTKAVRDAFYSSPALPRLVKAESISRTIADGVTRGLIGCARETARGALKLERRPGESLSESEVEVADDVFLLKAEDARKLLEPPRLALLNITPSFVSIRVGEKASFAAAGLDQYGQPCAINSLSWKATGGSVDPSGEFKAGNEPGVFAVRARANGIEGSAQIRITVSEREPEPDLEGTQRGRAALRWSGTIPPQKWMNFYTKIVSKYASNPSLRLTVSFEVPIDSGDAQSREQEMRTALKELGISDADGKP